ncbi:MAG: cysteine desulfurase, partial [Candidatus Omnitrophica bacterium]|nr:cysteine desulfurase [Candidatus Omnitrophota bacterium]
MKQGAKIYLDYAATTPIDKKVLKAMAPYFSEKYGNPTSIHSWGQEAQTAIDKAREQVAKFLNCKSSEIVFTGSASESDNFAIRGLLKALKRCKRAGEKIHIITSQIEHKAVLETCYDLEKENVKITYLPVGNDGIINLDDLKAEIIPETDLVSIMYVNNETGAIQPIQKIGRLLEEINKNKEHRIFFHTDAVQAANWLNCDVVEKLGVDLFTLSGHKIYGPKGIGVLYIRQGTPISSMITGGDQEWGLRAGTGNVAAIAGLGFALEQIKIQNTKYKIQTEKLRDKLVKGALTQVSNSELNGPEKPEERAPHIANFSFKGVEGEGLVISLDQEGIAASTGSACTSRLLKPSHVLMAMG